MSNKVSYKLTQAVLKVFSFIPIVNDFWHFRRQRKEFNDKLERLNKSGTPRVGGSNIPDDKIEHTIEYRDGVKWIKPRHKGNAGTSIWLSCPNCQHTNVYKIVGKKYQATGTSLAPDVSQSS